MKLIKKLKISLVLLISLSLSLPVYASPGKYVNLDQGEKIPWTGWCFDAIAMAKLLSDKELQDERCQLRLGESSEKLRATHDLEIEKLKAEMVYEVKTREESILALKKENVRIEQAIIHETRFGWIAPASFGVITGALTVIIVSALL
tara:strand:- start:98 stop:538 length:441 start_codon:yes stop_codon:yes gene_type:complete